MNSTFSWVTERCQQAAGFSLRGRSGILAASNGRRRVGPRGAIDDAIQGGESARVRARGSLTKRSVHGIVAGLAGLALLASCDSLPSPQVLYLGGGEYETSPSGRAVALVDWRFFHAIVNADAQVTPALGSVVDEIHARFDHRPESIVFILDYESTHVIWARMMRERGFQWLVSEGLSDEELPRFADAVSEATRSTRGRPYPPGAAFNSRYRQLETGTGSVEFFCPIGCPEGFRGYVFIPQREELVAGRFMHEFAHFWAARLHGPPVLERQVGEYHGHWGFTSVGGLLGGWFPDSFEDLGGGTYRADAAPAGWQQNVRAYAPLELYLMGLAPPAEVPPTLVAVDVSDAQRTEDRLVQFKAQRIDTVTIEDIIEANGPRIPAWPDAPATFDLMLVVITDDSLSAEEWDFYERSMDFMEGKAALNLRDVFPADQYQPQLDIWRELTEDDGERYMNFNACTNGRGRLRFGPD